MKVKLNNEKYRYDVFQIINLFYPLNDIMFVNDDKFDFKIDINEKDIYIFFNGKKELYVINNNIKLKQSIKNAVYMFLCDLTNNKFPWGTIIGIRPSKIAMKLLEENMTEEEIEEYFMTNYLASKEKARLCINIAKKEMRYINTNEKNISIYIGMPFCPSICAYCSFSSTPIKRYANLVEPYLNALYYEMLKINEYINLNNLNIECVYFGGGTPTSVNDNQFNLTLKNIYDFFIKNRNVKEFTVECGRPDSINLNKLQSMRKYNVTRISINPQTMNDKTLKLIGRNHSYKDIIDKFKLARQVGFDNINMDMIIGLPGENVDDVKNTCEQISKLKPDNLTIHGLFIKRGSKLHEKIVNHHNLNMSSQQEIMKMYEETEALSRKLQLEPYYMYKQKNMVGNMENIGYCKTNKEGIYNIQMIEERQTIIGIGANAVTKCIFLNENRIERFANLKDVNEYINRVDEMIDKKIKLLNTLYRE